MTDTADFYVYIHRRKTDRALLYIGKGRGKRAWLDNRRNKRWRKAVEKFGLVVEIFKDGLTEEQATKLEAEMIRKHICCETITNVMGARDGSDPVAHALITRNDIMEGLKHPDSEFEALTYIYSIGDFEVRQTVRAKQVRTQKIRNRNKPQMDSVSSLSELLGSYPDAIRLFRGSALHRAVVERQKGARP